MTYLCKLEVFELLQLPQEAQVRSGARPHRPDGGQGLHPAAPRHRHEVGHHQSDAAGRPGHADRHRPSQLVRPRFYCSEKLNLFFFFLLQRIDIRGDERLTWIFKKLLHTKYLVACSSLMWLKMRHRLIRQVNNI